MALFRAGAQSRPVSSSPAFFTAPLTGRRIVAGFSYLQRIGKGASTEVWFDEAKDLVLQTKAEWAAIRQFELLQEAGNLAIDELDVMDFKRTFQTLMRMRSGGYRVTILTLGHYTASSNTDDLEILDRKLQDEITQMIHFLYLSEMSEQINQHNHSAIWKTDWHFASALPHVAATLGARRLFRPEKETLKEKIFFDILERLPSRHIMHDTAVGLVLPDASKEKNWTYIAQRENQFRLFQQAITDIFSNLDKERAVMSHMRGYGDRLSPANDAHYKACALVC